MSGRGPCIIKGVGGRRELKVAPQSHAPFLSPIRLAYERSSFVMWPWPSEEIAGSPRSVDITIGAWY